MSIWRKFRCSRGHAFYLKSFVASIVVILALYSFMAKYNVKLEIFDSSFQSVKCERFDSIYQAPPTSVELISYISEMNDVELRLLMQSNRSKEIAASFSNMKAKPGLAMHLSPEKLQEIKFAYDKIFCKLNITEEMDILKMKIPPFIERFKNPCWYEGEELICVPYMYIVGADKCGTSDMYSKISKHPDLIPPSRKEPQWMPFERVLVNSSLSFYNNKYYSNLTKALSAEKDFSKKVTIDANVFNLQGIQIWKLLGTNVGKDEPVENTAEYIYHLNSKAKIMINVRNPIDKLWSEYLALTRNPNRSAAVFHDIVVRGIDLYNDCLQKRSLRRCMYDRNLVYLTMLSDEERKEKLVKCNVQPAYIVMLETGVFHVFIKDYMKVFPREQILVQRLEDISADSEGSLYKTYTFLDLDILPEDDMKKIANQNIVNSRRPLQLLKGDMYDVTRRLLYDFYKPHNEALAELMNDQKYNYGMKG